MDLLAVDFATYFHARGVKVASVESAQQITTYYEAMALGRGEEFTGFTGTCYVDVVYERPAKEDHALHYPPTVVQLPSDLDTRWKIGATNIRHVSGQVTVRYFIEIQGDRNL